MSRGFGRLGRDGDRLVGFSNVSSLSFGSFFGVKSVLYVCWFAGRLFAVFLSFSERPDPRSARASAVETPRFMLEPASKAIRFFSKDLMHFWVPWLPNSIKTY